MIATLVGMDQGPDAASPATLSRLQCGLIWKQFGPFRNGQVEEALEPVVNAWREARLIDAGLEPRWVARATLALASGAADGGVEVREVAERISTLLLRGLIPEVARPDSGERAEQQ